jgi:hypothetical protein
MSDTMNINGEHYAVHTFHGKVLPNHASSAPEIHTALAKHGKLYLQDSEGKQNVTEWVDTRVLEWVGHDVAKIWLAREGDENGITVGFFNATLNKFYWVADAWQGFFNHYPTWFKGQASSLYRGGEVKSVIKPQLGIGGMLKWDIWNGRSKRYEKIR